MSNKSYVVGIWYDGSNDGEPIQMWGPFERHNDAVVYAQDVSGKDEDITRWYVYEVEAA